VVNYNRFDPDEERLKQLMLQKKRMEAGLQAGPSGPQSPNFDPKVTGGKSLAEEMYVAPERDFSAQEGKLKNQRAYANMLRGREMPGLQKVGPSNIAVRNIYDSLGAGFDRALGGYLSGKADKASDELAGLKTEAGLERARTEAEANAAMEQRRRDEADQLLARDDAKIARDEARENAEGREVGEFTDGETVVRGYYENGVAYDESGDVLPDGWRRKPKEPTRSSGSTYHVTTTTDQYGNKVITKIDKTDQNRDPQVLFADGSEYDPERAESYAQTTSDTQASAAGAAEEAKGEAKLYVEQWGEAGEALDANSAAIAQYEAALQSIDEGANTGPIAAVLPSANPATIALENARDSQALTQIANYTFGSLSEAEGQWLKDTAIPLNMEEEPLKEWIGKKIEGLKRANLVEEYVLEMKKKGKRPDPVFMNKLKYGGGFSWE
jgi:hypothetical protein